MTARTDRTAGVLLAPNHLDAVTHAIVALGDVLDVDELPTAVRDATCDLMTSLSLALRNGEHRPADPNQVALWDEEGRR